MTDHDVPDRQWTQHDDVREWNRTVRTPATYRSEGPRRLAVGQGTCVVEYELSPLPEGIAISYSVTFTCHSYSSWPWKRYPSRDEALQNMLRDCSRYCRRELARTGDTASEARRTAATLMLERLNPATLFGFEEPEPLPREEWYSEMIAFEIRTEVHIWNCRLLDVVRGGDYRPISRSGSIFDIRGPRSGRTQAAGCERPAA